MKESRQACRELLESILQDVRTEAVTVMRSRADFQALHKVFQDTEEDHLNEVMGNGAWDVFSGGNEVVSAGHKVCELGSWSDAGALIARCLTTFISPDGDN